MILVLGGQSINFFNLQSAELSRDITTPDALCARACCAGFATSTGMGATSAILLSLCSSGDTVISQADVYGGTIAVMKADLARFGVNVVTEDVTEPDTLAKALESQLKRGANFVDRDPGIAANAAIGEEETQTRESVGNGLEKSADKASRCVVMIESVSNPLLKVANVRGIATVCHQYGALLVVDNTFATPLRNRPLQEVRSSAASCSSCCECY